MPLKGYKQSKEHKLKFCATNGYKLRPDGYTTKTICKNCGIEFVVFIRELERDKGKYCSINCLDQVVAKHRKIWNNIGNHAENSHLSKQARYIFNKAIKLGNIKKQSCEVCGSNIRVAGHHEDYSEPLNVKWLCPKHHVLEHYINNPPA